MIILFASTTMVGGPAIKLSNFFFLQTSYLVLDHVYIYYMTSHIKFGWKILPTTKVMEYNLPI
jgi:hypothetical protein